MVIWIVGMSGAGKSVLGRKIYTKIKAEKSNTVFVDGDEIRALFKHDRGKDAYSIEGRKKNAERICELCAWLDRQGINVVCSILSIFEESRDWNRETYSQYFEVYIKVPKEKLYERDIKNLYQPALDGKVENVVGVDIPFEEPKKPNFVFDNSKDNNDFDKVSDEVLNKAFNR